MVIADKIRSLIPEADISKLMEDVEELLDESIATEGYIIGDSAHPHLKRLVDLSKVNFEELKIRFESSHKRIEAEKLKGAINSKLKQMVRLNKSRTNYLEQFQKMIDEYNSGSMNIELFFDKLVAFAKDLNDEGKRSISENVTEEELAIFDLLTKPDLTLTEKEKDAVKKVTRDLLGILKREKLVLDWRKRQQSRAQVLITIQDVLDRGLPRIFTPELYQQKCNLIYQHVYDSYYGQERSVYTVAV